MSRHRLALLVVSALAFAACSSAPPGSPGGSGGGSAEPSAGPTGGETGAIDHPTGATDVLLRLEEGGGFVMPSWLAAQTPVFSLYGDGTVVFRNAVEPPPPAEGPIIRGTALRTAKLSEEQIQSLLSFALNESGLGVARAKYDNNTIADAGSAIFTVKVTGLDKRVEVYALGFDDGTGPDGPARKAFGKLADRLRDFDEGGSIATDAWTPTRYRGYLIDGVGMADPPMAWPWKDVTPAEFVKPADDALVSFPARELSADEAAAIGIDDIAGGLQNVLLKAPDGKTVYSFVLRPLLPDEKA